MMCLLTRNFSIGCIALLWLCMSVVHATDGGLHHDLQVELDPAGQTLHVIDRITLTSDVEIQFVLHAGLQPRVTSTGAELIAAGRVDNGIELETYRLKLAAGTRMVTLEYGGRIAHEFQSLVESPGRRRQLLAGTISTDGVFLDGGVAWYPLIADRLVTFDLQVTMPKDWLVVSQGRGPETNRLADKSVVTWRCPHPQDDIYLVAGRFHFYADEAGGTQAQVFLRQPDAELAQRYLEATHQYLGMYRALIGDYPYSKFALVENFWQTGYGMPSFTLLGSRVIRLPFILHSSYPHEILHNWWGNGVFIDATEGNWAEGLTAYLADHLIKEQQRQGVAHRRASLQRYASFVRDANDFPLREFRARHSGSSQAIGYDKSMMLFHMLRRKLGDARFIDGLRHFYRTQRFRHAGFADLQQSFEQVSGENLQTFFQQWLQRTGAPRIELKDAGLKSINNGYRIELRLTQAQSEDAFTLEVPVVVYPRDGSGPVTRRLSMTRPTQQFVIDVPTEPLRLDIDPGFDLFRLPDESEVPPTLGQLFGAEQVTLILPGDAPKELLQGYRNMARQWAAGYPKADIVVDAELSELPEKGQVWLLGWSNRFLDRIVGSLEPGQFAASGEQLSLAGETLAKQQHSLVLARRIASGRVLGWVGTLNPAALPGLARKLPHYGKYSYLAFAGNAPSIQHKGQWAVTRSVLKFRFGDGNEPVDELVPTPLWPVSR